MNLEGSMKSPIFLLQISATLSEKDLKAIQEALDRAYQAGYDAGMAANKPYTYPAYPNTNTFPLVYCQNV